MKRKADANNLGSMEQVAKKAGDKRFLAQLAGVKKLLDAGDWRGVLIGCRMLYKISHEGGYLDRIEPLLRPVFDLALKHFEESRVAMVRIYSRLLSSSRKTRQVERLSRLARVLT